VQNSELTTSPSSATQRADLTFKHNALIGRHGWLRLTPAYSVKIVDSILNGKDKSLIVFDPFSGTATTPLCAAYRGHYAIATEINPFLVWLGRVKTQLYSSAVIVEAIEKSELIHRNVATHKNSACVPPPIANINRWWQQDRIDLLCSVKGEIEQQSYSYLEAKNLLLVAFCRLLIELSNAAFNHQSMSFRDSNKNTAQSSLSLGDSPTSSRFLDIARFVINSAAYNPEGVVDIISDDARYLVSNDETKYDIIITSPPYPNRMSYIRELRPYMYWLGYLQDAREAGEMDWRAIGGTWGIATSRLNDWERSPNVFFPEYFENILRKISQSDGKSGELLSKYVEKYFEDMWLHFNSIRSGISSKGEIHYIIGNSKFYECLVPAEQIFTDMLKRAGFRDIRIETLRRRTSKKDLFEFHVYGHADQ